MAAVSPSSFARGSVHGELVLFPPAGTQHPVRSEERHASPHEQDQVVRPGPSHAPPAKPRPRGPGGPSRTSKLKRDRRVRRRLPPKSGANRRRPPPGTRRAASLPPLRCGRAPRPANTWPVPLDPLARSAKGDVSELEKTGHLRIALTPLRSTAIKTAIKRELRSGGRRGTRNVYTADALAAVDESTPAGRSRFRPGEGTCIQTPMRHLFRFSCGRLALPSLSRSGHQTGASL